MNDMNLKEPCFTEFICKQTSFVYNIKKSVFSIMSSSHPINIFFSLNRMHSITTINSLGDLCHNDFHEFSVFCNALGKTYMVSNTPPDYISKKNVKKFINLLYNVNDSCFVTHIGALQLDVL